MNNNTIDYYNQNATEFCQRTLELDMSYCQDKFLNYLQKGNCILDAGCGSGRDSKYFLEQGMEVISMDAAEKMCKLAAQYIGQPVKCLRFEDMEWEEEFDGVWASASLLHVRKTDLLDVLVKLHRALKKKGILYISVKYGAAQEERMGRFFSDYSVGELKEILKKEGLFDVLECFETADSREGYENKLWVNAIAQRK